MAKLRKLESRSLRNPGQSLDEEVDRIIHDDFMSYYLLAATLWVIAAIEWFARTLHLPRAPAAYALAALIATALCTLKFVRTKTRVRNLRKGRDGERNVAEILEEFKSFGAQVLHDIPSEKGNIDHVVICTRGIFVVETKAWSKPDNVWRMDFDGEHIHIATHAPEAAPIIQCKAETADIRVLLKNSTAKTYPVRGVVVFVDWFVNRRPTARGSDIWVLNPKELVGWIRREPETLSDADVAMATLHLKQYVKKLAA